MSILCRIGLHAWMPVMRIAWYPPNADYGRSLMIQVAPVQVGHVCRHCRKRVRI
ncbi:MAG: hypothetical protein ABW154_14180 [Dyella sp.]